MIGIGIVLATGVVALVALAFIMKPHFDQFKMKAMQKEGMVLLSASYQSLLSGQVELGEFRQEDFDILTSDPNFSGGRYKLSTHHPLCPDCGINKERFKVVAIGNLDEDETEDVWTMDQDKNLVQLSDDIKN